MITDAWRPAEHYQQTRALIQGGNGNYQVHSTHAILHAILSVENPQIG